MEFITNAARSLVPTKNSLLIAVISPSDNRGDLTLVFDHQGQHQALGNFSKKTNCDVTLWNFLIVENVLRIFGHRRNHRLCLKLPDLFQSKRILSGVLTTFCFPKKYLINNFYYNLL